MKQEIYTISIFYRLLCLALLPFFTTACLYEYPTLTKDGELGIDPTVVNVNVDLTLNLKFAHGITETVDYTGAADYRHRFIVDAYLDRQLASRHIIYKEPTDDEEFTANLSMQLHARDYQLVVWADYVKADNDDDLYYDTSTLVPAINTKAYWGNAEYKDVFYASQPLPLGSYRDQWDVEIPVSIEMERPVARYELIADDVKKFLKNIASGDITGNKFTLTVRYTNLFSTGWNALDGIVKNALRYISYNQTIPVPTAETENLRVGLDYVFVPDGNADIPIAVEVADAKGKVIALTYLLLECKANQNQIIHSNFLTADPSGGVGFDPDYDDNINDGIEVESNK